MITAAELHRRADLLAAAERGEGVLEIEGPAGVWTHCSLSARLIGSEHCNFRLAPLPPKPCPFCGAVPRLFQATPTHLVVHAPDCAIREIIGNVETVIDPRDVPAWNRRAQP